MRTNSTLPLPPWLPQQDCDSGVQCTNDCVYTPWTYWSGCSASCGGGTQISIRSNTSGTVCGPFTQTALCNMQSCYVAPSASPSASPVNTSATVVTASGKTGMALGLYPLVGVVVGSTLAVALLAVFVWSRRRRNGQSGKEEEKDDKAPLVPVVTVSTPTNNTPAPQAKVAAPRHLSSAKSGKQAPLTLPLPVDTNPAPVDANPLNVHTDVAMTVSVQAEMAAPGASSKMLQRRQSKPAPSPGPLLAATPEQQQEQWEVRLLQPRQSQEAQQNAAGGQQAAQDVSSGSIIGSDALLPRYLDPAAMDGDTVAFSRAPPTQPPPGPPRLRSTAVLKMVPYGQSAAAAAARMHAAGVPYTTAPLGRLSPRAATSGSPRGDTSPRALLPRSQSGLERQTPTKFPSHSPPPLQEAPMTGRYFPGRDGSPPKLVVTQHALVPPDAVPRLRRVNSSPTLARSSPSPLPVGYGGPAAGPSPPHIGYVPTQSRMIDMRRDPRPWARGEAEEDEADPWAHVGAPQPRPAPQWQVGMAQYMPTSYQTPWGSRNYNQLPPTLAGPWGERGRPGAGVPHLGARARSASEKRRLLGARAHSGRVLYM